MDSEETDQEKENKEKKKSTKASVYFNSEYYENTVKKYRKEMGYTSISKMLQIAFRTLTWLRPLDSGAANSNHMSLADQLENIQKRLDELEFQKKFLEKERAEHRNINEALDLEQFEALGKIKEIKLDLIPNNNVIITDIMDLLTPDGVRDFVLMEQMRQYGHKDSTVWLVLYKLRELGKLKLENGMWYNVAI